MHVRPKDWRSHDEAYGYWTMLIQIECSQCFQFHDGQDRAILEPSGFHRSQRDDNFTEPKFLKVHQALFQKVLHHDP